MEEKAYHTITISELADQANVGRKTFYRHFSSKEDVLVAYFDRLTEFLTQRLKKVEDLDISKVLRVILHLIKEKGIFFKSLYANGLMTMFFSYWKQKLPILHQTFSQKLRYFPKTSPEALDYLLAFNVGASFNILSK